MHSSLYTASVTTISGISSGSTIPLGSIIRKTGCACDLNGNSILLNSMGYYLITANFTVTPSASDTVTVQALRDGVAIPGALAKASTDAMTTLPVSFMVKNCCCNTGSNISFTITAGTATTTFTESNGAAVVRKL